MSTRPIRYLLAGVLALAGLALLPVPAASAAVPTGPSAVAVSSNGITYVGFSSGGTLSRVDASGAVLSPIPLTRPGPVEGLAIDSADNIWVSNGTLAYKISPTGTELSSFRYEVGAGGDDLCPVNDGSGDPTRYGGIAVSSTSVYVSHRCGFFTTRYSLTGTKLAEVGTSYATRGIAFGVAQNGQPAKVYLASPDTGKVLVYAENLTSQSPGPQGLPTGPPIFTLDVPRAGPDTPIPAGVVVDRYGQLAVSDVANNYVLLFDTNNINGTNSYSWYRTLGRPGGNAGDLNNPTALAQYPVDGPLQDRRGDFFVGDTGNQRIQRWNTSGYTYWVAPTNGGTTTPSAPVNLTRPAVSGTASVGSTLTCSNGTWSGSPTSFTYGWNKFGSSIGGETDTTYVVRSGDAGQQISCFVRAGNAAGQSDFATSDPITIGAAPAAPTSTAPPVISGTAQQGSTLTCSNGTFTGSPTAYTRVWKRNDTTIAGATGTTYAITASDVGQAITCTVTATNGAGSGSATSAPVTPTAPSTCTGVLETVSINAAAAYTNSQAVSLKIVPPPGATQVLISNDGGFGGATPQALAGTCTYSWTLSTTGGKASRTVYARFLSGGGATVGQASDDIVLDQGGPALARPVARKARGKFVITVKARDGVSGVATVQYAKSRSGKATTVGYGSRATKTFRAKHLGTYRWFRVYDKAGNASAWKSTLRR